MGTPASRECKLSIVEPAHRSGNPLMNFYNYSGKEPPHWSPHAGQPCQSTLQEAKVSCTQDLSSNIRHLNCDPNWGRACAADKLSLGSVCSIELVAAFKFLLLEGASRDWKLPSLKPEACCGHHLRPVQWMLQMFLVPGVQCSTSQVTKGWPNRGQAVRRAHTKGDEQA